MEVQHETPASGGDVRVLVVGHDALARAGLASLVADRAGYIVVGQAGGSTLDAGLAGLSADVVLWDLGWDPALGLGHLGGVSGAAPPIVALLSDESAAADALAAGARGLLPRDADAATLAASLGAAAHGLVVLDPDLTAGIWSLRRRAGAALPEELTPRELEVLQLLAEGLSNKAIAGRLEISEHTAKYHVNAILAKLTSQTRTEAVARAARLGLVLF
jgi:two-component system, NarL family, nitrate/nitrite response regulator NarL